MLDKKTIRKILRMKSVHLKKLLKDNQRMLCEAQERYKVSTGRTSVNYNLRLEPNSHAFTFLKQIHGYRDNIRAIEVRIKAVALATNKWQVIRESAYITMIYDELLMCILLDDYGKVADRINYRYGNRNRLWSGSYVPAVKTLEELTIFELTIPKDTLIKVNKNGYLELPFKEEVGRIKESSAFNAKRLLDMNKVTIAHWSKI